MYWLRNKLRTWLGISKMEIATHKSFSVLDERVAWLHGQMGATLDEKFAELQSQVADANAEIDRLRKMITAPPEKRVYHPRTAAQFRQLMSR